MLLPAILWLGIVYLGSLFALLLQSFFSIDEFSGLINHEFTLKTYAELFRPQNLDIIIRTVSMAALVTRRLGHRRVPHRLYGGALRPGEMEGAVLSRHHAAALGQLLSVKIYAWKLILAKRRHPQLDLRAAAPDPACSRRGWSIPVIGGNSLSISYTGTFLVFLYVWMPYMILPIQAAIERVPVNLLDASADLGATPRQTFEGDLSACAAGRYRRLDLHLLADAGRLHHPADRGELAVLHRPGGLFAPGHGRATFRSPRPSPWCRSSSWAST